MEKVPVQIVLRPYASALPLASFAFATGNVLYSAFLLHWIPASQAPLLSLVLLCFVAPLELIPSVMAFLTRDSGGATAFGIFGTAWVVLGLQLLLRLPQHGAAAGCFSLCLAICVGMIATVTMPGKPLLGSVLLVAVVRLVAAAMADVWTAGFFQAAAGFCGLALAALAFYAALVFLQEDVTQKLSPFTLRQGKAREAMEGGFEKQLAEITREAGVRKQL